MIFNLIPPLYMAFMSTFVFAFSSIAFAKYSEQISPLWMNATKALVAFVAFFATTLITQTWINIPPISIVSLLLSGLLGLMIGDYFMLYSMAALGSSRMLMIFGIQPFLLGSAAYFLFGQKFEVFNFIGVLCMTLCLFIFSFERYKSSGKWDFKGLLYGLIAVSFDAIGILLTRSVFNANAGISPIQVNLIRCFGALLGFIFFNQFIKPIHLISVFKNQTKSDQRMILIGSLGGTYLSLMFYLSAIGRGQLSVISSVAITGPLFASIIECLRYRRWPSKYLLLSFVFFFVGFLIFQNVLIFKTN